VRKLQQNWSHQGQNVGLKEADLRVNTLSGFKGKKRFCAPQILWTQSPETRLFWALRIHQPTGCMDFPTQPHSTFVSSDRDDFSSYQKYDEKLWHQAFRKQPSQRVGEGDIIAKVEFRRKNHEDLYHTKSCTYLEQTEKYFLKRLRPEGFEDSHLSGHLRIHEIKEVYVEAISRRQFIRSKMKIIPRQESVMAAVKRDADATDLLMLAQETRPPRRRNAQRSSHSKTVQGNGRDQYSSRRDMLKECILSKMEWKTFQKTEKTETLNSLAHYMPIS